MKLVVYKGFETSFFSGVKGEPLLANDIAEKKNIFKFSKSTMRKLDAALLSMDDDDERWITYEEYALIKDRVELAVQDYGLKVTIMVNNLYPDYYPLECEIGNELLSEIESAINGDSAEEVSEECDKFINVYNSLESVDGVLYVSFYNYELDKGYKVETKPYYPATIAPTLLNECDMYIHIANDIPLYLNEIAKIKRTHPGSVGYSITKGEISKRNYSSFVAFCQFNGITISEHKDQLDVYSEREPQFIDIAKNVIGIPNFESFRKLKFYRNPDISNDTIDVSQAQIINDIITQAENSYVEPHDFRDIFITASTGAGKSVMFQIPAVYLAQKYKKLTIIIEPVKALMQDQKEQLNARGFNRVETFNSDLISQAEKEAVLKKVKEGETDLLYLSPETLLSYSMETLIGDREIGLIIIDEAHIVTTWGVGFRPDYWYLGGYINRLRNQIQTKFNKGKKINHFPVCAFTATAVNGGIDDSVSETIISLYMENPIKYIGYVKRDNIKFDINIKESDKLPNPLYEGKKATDLVSRINSWTNAGTKTIAYFPYASYADDAIKGIKSFAGKAFDRSKVAIYTGRVFDDISAAAASETKKEAFEDFRTGRKPVMLATKAFGMGVDVNDIKNVYHYAVTGNLSDYVQEIGRAARKADMTGLAITDYYYNDISFMQRLFGMSQIRQYQINRVLSGVYNTYKSKKGNRSFLITPDSFTYIFTGKDNNSSARNKNDSQINKLKTCLLMLEKDLYDKYNFKVLIARPQGVFTKAFVCVFDEKKDTVLNSEYGKYFRFVAKGRDKESDRSLGKYGTVSDCGDIYSLDLKSIWEEFYPNISFPQFKYWYFNKNSKSKEKVDVMPSINDAFFARQKVTVETKQDLLLCELREKILEDFDYVGDVLYSKFRKSYFTLEDFAKAISKKYGIAKARIISHSLFELVDPNGKCVKYRSYDERTENVYTLANGIFKELLTKSITSAPFIKNLYNNQNTNICKYMLLSPDSSDSVALKLLSVFDYITYEVVGGEEPEIFIRLNDPEKIRRIVTGEIKYSNSYVTRAKQKHEREVKILRKFFAEKMNDEERWNYIEEYFLGDDVLKGNDPVEAQKLPLVKAVDKDKSWSVTNEHTWEIISEFFEEDMQRTISEIDKLKIPTPDYLTTALKHNMVDGDIVMSWIDKNVLIFSESISEEDRIVCSDKGWTVFDLRSFTPDELKEALS